MSIYVDSNGRLHHDQAGSLALTCPHCQVFAHISPLSTPQFDELVAYKPAQVGVVYRCDACNAPIFLRFPVKMYGGNRVELGASFVELERAVEKFDFTYLPESAEVLFREALTCYTHAAFNAFASMCRRTAHAIFHDLGDSGRLRLFDQLNEVREMAGLDEETFLLLKKIVFGSDSDPYPSLPEIDDEQSSVLLEVMKDLLYETYVRRGRLQQALVLRRIRSSERPAHTVTTLAGAQS